MTVSEFSKGERIAPDPAVDGNGTTGIDPVGTEPDRLEKLLPSLPLPLIMKDLANEAEGKTRNPK